ncbi:hypothetical protein MIND_00765800 [Mycena indigotica]|uniref:Uncharacterized protein n=1 Tax=Mycena indigotica TaxID=2126181 RepID=A0A8H6W3X5_9AGAR|nr:uncharacterized protein MIND_00765800 [Mycena indigotica]KAF7301996.1 hypothetical protein MIND_00765800 [Mycena indigotica]
MLSALYSGIGHVIDYFTAEAPASSSSSSSEPHQPTMQDLIAVRTTLTKFVPPELAYIILDFANYWTSYSLECTKSQSASASMSPNTDATNIYLVSDPILPPNGIRVRGVQFVVRSRDQGWCNDGNLRETYHGATWHEAAILRPSTPQTSDVIRWLALNSPMELESSAIVAGYTPQLEVHSSWDAAKSRWLVQKNFTASYESRTHSVSWYHDTGEKFAKNDLDEQTGAGDGRGFVQLLTPGDRIALMVRARYPGWVNHIERAAIIVYYALA